MSDEGRHVPVESLLPVLAVAGVDKSFPGVRALVNVSFDCRAGEIHGLVGENGAGKSTLMRILAGVYRPDSGTIRIRGKGVTLTSPRHAHDLGIAMVYQDTRLVGELDVAQNIWLEREPGTAWFIDRSEMERRSAAILQRLGIRIDLRRRVGELSVAERQIVEIARALTADPAVLILDEPTSSLDPGESEQLGKILAGLRTTGTGIVFISHRLPEVLAFADRITVMKDGQIVSTLENQGIAEETLVSLMVGRQLSLAFPSKTGKTGATRLEVEGLSSPGNFQNVSFSVAAGEIVGFGGIQGNGQREIARALYGLLPATGQVRLNGSRITLGSPGDAIRAGIVYVPADRRGEGLFIAHSVRENVAVPHLSAWSKFGVMSNRREAAAVRETIHRLRVRTPSPEQPVGFLSGGNQQKVVFGRWLLTKPLLYIFEEPAVGVDVGTKLELYRVLRGLADEGAAVLVLSSDLIELIGVCDRILVVAHGSIADSVTAAEATEERIIGSAVGKKRAHAVAKEATGRDPGQRARRVSIKEVLLRRYAGAGLLCVLILLLGAYTTSRSPYFLTERNLGNLVTQVAPLAFVAIGQMAVILISGIDLSVGPSMSLTTALASYVLAGNAPVNLTVGIVLCLAAGMLIGALNGFIILYCRISDLIATLSTFSVVTGLALIVRPSPGGNVSEAFSDAITTRIGWFPIIGLAVILLTVVGEILQVRGRIGTRLYAIGSNPEAAFVAGIPVGRVRFFAYLFCGLTAALAGLVIAARIGSGDPQAGSQFTLASVTAVVVGGTSIFGGRGTVVGTVLGATLLILMQNVLNQLHVSAYYQYIWTGTLMLLAVAAYSVHEHTNLSAQFSGWLQRNLRCDR
ncbi:MAG: ATP-binding cassette domain-containing protein [Verrucomicrobia bacterium]|nr:ATP-binding cassette domain-containing protein [Verrucomicrobiota bacterium]